MTKETRGVPWNTLSPKMQAGCPPTNEDKVLLGISDENNPKKRKMPGHIPDMPSLHYQEMFGIRKWDELKKQLNLESLSPQEKQALALLINNPQAPTKKLAFLVKRTDGVPGGVEPKTFSHYVIEASRKIRHGSKLHKT